MKNLIRMLFTRRFQVLFFVFGFVTLCVYSQKEILLYTTDFTDWDQLNYHPGYGEDTFTDSSMGSTVNGSTTFAGSGTGGTGFSLAAKPAVMPSGSISTKKGYAFFGNSSGAMLTSKTLKFISGGAVELTFYHDYSNHTSSNAGSSISTRNFTLDYGGSTTGITTIVNSVPTGVSLTSNQPKVGSTAITALNTAYSGSQFTTAKTAGFYTVTFIFPSTMTGNQILNLVGGSCKDLYITSIKVYSGVGTVPYVASTNYQEAPAAGLSITGTVGGSAVSGTVNVKAWNTTGPVSMSLVGTDAAKFSLPVATLTNTQALASQNVTVNFTPSVRVGVSSAQLKLTCPSDPAANTYYVNLSGITGGGSTPQIVANTDTLAFWTNIVGMVSNTLNISGLNLTGDVSVSIVGSSRYTLSTTTIAKADALAGTTLKLTYRGNVYAGQENAKLVLSSPGATNVTIPLMAVTSVIKPTLYKLNVGFDTPGAAYVNYSPTSTSGYLSGSTVTVTITLENGWKILKWSDAVGNSRSKRTFKISEDKDLIVYLVSGTQVDPNDPGTTGSLTGYVPSPITTSGFTVAWSSVASATSYTVKVYDASGNIIPSLTTSTSATTTTVSGLSSGTMYYYSVETTVAGVTQSTGLVGPFKTSGASTPFVCGQP